MGGTHWYARRRLLPGSCLLGRQRFYRALGIRPDTKDRDGGSSSLESLFVCEASPAVAAFFLALCGEEGDLERRAESAAEGLRSPDPSLGSISQKLRPLIDFQTRVRLGR